MTNGLVQHLTVEESTSIQWVNYAKIKSNAAYTLWHHFGRCCENPFLHVHFIVELTIPEINVLPK